jgi:hypothetical protein
MTEQERRSNWTSAHSLCGPVWPAVLDDLVQFAMVPTDPAVRCGRLDVIAYILDSVIANPEDSNG